MLDEQDGSAGKLDGGSLSDARTLVAPWIDGAAEITACQGTRTCQTDPVGDR